MLLFFLLVSFLFTRKVTKRGTFIACKETKRNKTIISRLRRLGDYIPPTWYSADIGTLLAFGIDLKLKYEREMIDADDAVFALDWYPYKPIIKDTSNSSDQSSTSSSSQPSSIPHKIIVFLPGLGLHSRNKFCQNFVSYAHKEAGYICAVLNPRGLVVPLKTKKVWYPGMHEDTLLVLQILQRTYPNSQLFLVGYSAGSNLVMRTLTDPVTKVKNLKGAMCVCVNRDYLTARNNLENSFRGCIYSFLMTMAYKDIIKRNAHIHNEIGEDVVNKILSCHFLSDYDRIAAVHLHNFKTLTDYNKTLSIHSTAGIEVPLLTVQPFDDPLHLGRVREHVQVDDFIMNDNVIFYEPEYGNHFGFYEGSLPKMFTNKTSYTFPSKLAIEFFNTIIDEK